MKDFLLLSFIYLTIKLSDCQLCHSINQTLGVWKIDRECNFLLKLPKDDHKTHQDLVKNRLGFSGSSPIICCPLETSSRIDLENDEPNINLGLDKIGTECKLFNKIPGICTIDSECSFALTLSKSHRRAFQSFVSQRCGFQENSIIFCCPLNNFANNLLLTLKSDTKSVKACRDFGKPPPLISSRIIGGREARANELPFFASLGYETDGKINFNCGGALISQKFVVTAAHCCKKRTNMRFCLVRLGKTKINDSQEDFVTDYEVKNVIIHPEYKFIGPKYNDIALVELNTSVDFNAYIWPACLIQQENVESLPLIIAGFGQKSVFDPTLQSNELLTATVEEIPLIECRNNYNDVYKGTLVQGLPDGIKDTLLCAKSRGKHADTCRGDSGSALALLNENTHYIVGITSFGVSCNTSLPAFYTRVWKYSEWIENIVWPNS